MALKAGPLPLRVPDLKRMLKAVQEMGLEVSGIQISPDGTIQIRTTDQIPANEEAANIALAGWIRHNG